MILKSIFRRLCDTEVFDKFILLASYVNSILHPSLQMRISSSNNFTSEYLRKKSEIYKYLKRVTATNNTDINLVPETSSY